MIESECRICGAPGAQGYCTVHRPDVTAEEWSQIQASGKAWVSGVNIAEDPEPEWFKWIDRVQLAYYRWRCGF